MENSQRRIRILEEMTRALYREWFLCGERRGRPGRFGDIATLVREGINPSEFPDQEFEHFSIPSFDDGRTPAVELGEAILSNKYSIDGSCVLLSKLNPRIPRVWLPKPFGAHRAITSTEFLVLKPKAGFTCEFIYAQCSSEEFAGQFASLAIGTSTSHQRVKPESLLSMRSEIPGSDTVARFSKLVAPMLEMSQNLRVRFQNLRRTRDLLLPRLLSGEIEVAA